MSGYENITRDFNLYLDGDSFLGKVTSYQPPAITVINPGYRAGGLDAPIPLDMGLEAMQATVEFGGFAPAVVQRVGAIGETVSLILRAGLITEGEPVRKLVEEIRGVVLGSERGAMVPGESQTHTLTVGVTFYQVELENERLIRVDVQGRVREVGGTDRLADLRDAIGL